jgi:hypothetical protein
MKPKAENIKNVNFEYGSTIASETCNQKLQSRRSDFDLYSFHSPCVRVTGFPALP